ncbi:hypothetical protein HDA40_001933 [Hamadaea flava]|nr:hypothetical protein [Hamadaea flava]
MFPSARKVVSVTLMRSPRLAPFMAARAERQTGVMSLVMVFYP